VIDYLKFFVDKRLRLPRFRLIYVMPENKIMTIEDGRLRLSPRDLSIKVNKAIDIFLNSLAKDSQFLKVAVILSGLGVDGTKGVEALSKKEHTL
jgi:two-component system CheB/CheR fusion protein